MYEFENNSPDPEVQQVSSSYSDVQRKYSHIPDLCMNMHNFQELLDATNPIPDDAKMIIKTFLTQARLGLTSMTELIHHLIKETQELSQQNSQSVQSELKFLKLELDTEKEKNVKLQKTNCHLMASQTQLKMDLLQVFQSKNQRIAELEEEVAKTKHNQSSKVVGFQRNLHRMWTYEEQDTGRQSSSSLPERKPEEDYRRYLYEGDGNNWPTVNPFTSKSDLVKILNEYTQGPSPGPIQTSVAQNESQSFSAPQAVLEETPETVKTRTNVRKPARQPVQAEAQLGTSQTRVPEEIPAEDFFVISDEVETTELNNRLILSNILNRDYGRVVGRGGKNAERLEKEYGVKISFLDRSQEILKLVISEGDVDSRRAASNDIIENLPLVFECPRIQTNNRNMKQVSYLCDVAIKRTSPDNAGVTICGRINNCREAYKQLLKDE